MKNINNDIDKILKAIRLIRETKKLTQEEISEKMDITQSQYARFERGATKTDLEMLNSFASAVNMSLIDVITFPEIFISSKNIGNSGIPKIKIEFEMDLNELNNTSIREKILSTLNK